VLVTPDEKDKERARKIFDLYKAKPKSEHIATEWSLLHLSALQRKINPTKVLEIGGGIGTITTLLLYSSAHITVVEPNPAYQKLHMANVGEHPRYKMVSDVKQGKFDLVIIDGDTPEGFEDYWPSGTVVFVEGHRQDQRNKLEWAKKVEKFTNYKPDRLTEHFWKPHNRRKGCHIGVIV
jgi:predicted O-methyltransferase YrrM